MVRGEYTLLSTIPEFMGWGMVVGRSDLMLIGSKLSGPPWKGTETELIATDH